MQLLKVFHLSSPERPVLLLAVLFRLLSEGANLANPLILARAYDALVHSQEHPDQLASTRQLILSTFTLVLSLHFGGQLSGFLSTVLTGVAGERVVARLRTRLYAHLLTQDMTFFDAHKSGELVSRLGSDTLLVQQATTSSLNEFLIGAVKVVAGVTLMFVVSWQMTLIVFLTILSWLCLICVPGTTRVPV